MQGALGWDLVAAAQRVQQTSKAAGNSATLKAATALEQRVRQVDSHPTAFGSQRLVKALMCEFGAVPCMTHCYLIFTPGNQHAPDAFSCTKLNV